MATGTINRPLQNTAVNNIGVVGVGGLRVDYLNPDGQYYLAIYKTGNNLVTLFDKDWHVIWQIPTAAGNIEYSNVSAMRFWLDNGRPVIRFTGTDGFASQLVLASGGDLIYQTNESGSWVTLYRWSPNA